MKHRVWQDIKDVAEEIAIKNTFTQHWLSMARPVFHPETDHTYTTFLLGSQNNVRYF